jgi:hypothetical protein
MFYAACSRYKQSEKVTGGRLNRPEPALRRASTNSTVLKKCQKMKFFTEIYRMHPSAYSANLYPNIQQYTVDVDTRDLKILGL